MVINIQRELFVLLFAMASTMTFDYLKKPKHISILKHIFKLIQDTRGFRSFMQNKLAKEKR